MSEQLHAQATLTPEKKAPILYETEQAPEQIMMILKLSVFPLTKSKPQFLAVKYIALN
jgi:hypothetical protein